jgi:hypothetical protein
VSQREKYGSYYFDHLENLDNYGNKKYIKKEI